MTVYDKIRDRLEDEMHDICKQDKLSTSDVEDIYKMVDIVKDITTIEAMDRENHSRGSYDRGYSSREYSNSSSKEELIDKLDSAMMRARSEDERDSYRRAIEQLKR